MSCNTTEAATKIGKAFEDAIGLRIPHDSWSKHVASGAPAPEQTDLEIAYETFTYYMCPPGDDDSPSMVALREAIEDNPGLFTAKHEWMMRNIKIIREDAERKHAATPGESEYAITVQNADGSETLQRVAAKSKKGAEKAAKTANPDAVNVKSGTDSLGRPWVPRRNYSGYTVSNPKDVLEKLERQGIKPENERLFLEHVTYQFPDKESAPEISKVEIVGHTSVDGVQAVVVAVDGSTARPDGSTYHITMSLAEGRKPFESNKAIQENGYETLEYPITLKVDPF